MTECLKKDLKPFGCCKVTPFLMEHLNCFLKVFLFSLFPYLFLPYITPYSSKEYFSCIILPEGRDGFRMRGERVSGLGGYRSPVSRSKNNKVNKTFEYF